MPKIEKVKSFLFKNTSTRQTVTKNTIWLMISNFGGRLIKATIVIFGARVLGTTEWGIFSYATTLAGFFTLFMDPGINGILMREAPKAPENEKKKIFSTTLILKIGLIIATAIFVFFVAPLFSTLPGAKALIPIIILIISFDTIREFFSAFIRTMEKMEWEAGIFLFTNLIIVVSGFILLTIHPSAKNFAWAYVIGSATGGFIAVIILKKYIKGAFSYFDSKIIRPLINSAWPFAVTGALGVLLTNTDILIISWMKTASDVGIYSAAIRIVQIFYLIPIILQFSTMPILARLAGNKENERFRNFFEKSIGSMFLFSIPLALGGVILGKQIIDFIFGAQYLPGALAFEILMITMLVDFPSALISTAIFAYNHQKSLIIASLIGGIGNVIFDLFLIPKFGIAGSAVATLVAQTLSNWYLWHKMNEINKFEILSKLKLVIISGIIMSITTLILFVAGVNIVINIAISAIIYLGLLILLREPIFADTLETFGLKTKLAKIIKW